MVRGGCVATVLIYNHPKETFWFARLFLTNPDRASDAYLFEFFYLFLTYCGVIYSQHFHGLLLIQPVLVDSNNDLWTWRAAAEKAWLNY